MPIGGVPGMVTEGRGVAGARGVQPIHIDVQVVEHQLPVLVEIPVHTDGPDVLAAATNTAGGAGCACDSCIVVQVRVRASSARGA